MIPRIVALVEPLMRWLRRRGRPPRRRQRATLVRLPGAPARRSPEPAPAQRELIEVLGIGRTEAANGVALTLLSLERYREGDTINFRMTRKRGFLQRDIPSPELFIRVGPSSSTQTPRFSGVSGGGGGGMQEITYRFSFGVSPGMPDDATDWVVEVTKIEWVKPYRSPERRVWSIDHGPWRFVIRP